MFYRSKEKKVNKSSQAPKVHRATMLPRRSSRRLEDKLFKNKLRQVTVKNTKVKILNHPKEFFDDYYWPNLNIVNTRSSKKQRAKSTQKKAKLIVVEEPKQKIIKTTRVNINRNLSKTFQQHKINDSIQDSIIKEKNLLLQNLIGHHEDKAESNNLNNTTDIRI